MCGIVGAYGLVDLPLLAKMKSSLRHRGPDQEGTYSDEHVMLGHQRLSILDLSEKGRQPMSNEDKTVWTVFNGEIYNYKTLRTSLEAAGHRFSTASDTEVLVHGHEEWGEGLASRLDGDFAYVVWDASKKKLYLARDGAGVCPLYFTQHGGAFFFASEIKAFFEHDDIPRRLSVMAFQDYLTFRYPLGPKTLFEGIFKVIPGEMVVVGEDLLVHKKRFFEVQYHQTPWTETFAVEKVRQLFTSAVHKRLQSDVPLGVYLSGGLDSSFVVAAASGVMPAGTVHTFSVAFGDDGDADETPYVDEVVSRFNTKHTPLRVDSNRYDVLGQVCWHLDEPPADVAAVPTYLMAEATKPHATVVLTGDGGDEVFGGYTRYSALLKVRQFRALKAASFIADLALPSHVAARLKQALRSTDDWDLFLAYVAAFSEEEKKEWLSSNERAQPIVRAPFAFISPSDFLNRMMSFDRAYLLPDDYLMKVNKTSLAFAVEARVPFLDKELVEFCASLPVSMKATLTNTRIIQRKAMTGLVPEKIIRRSKHGFNVPTQRWLSEGLKEVAAQQFESLGKRGYFRKEKLDAFLPSFGKDPARFSRPFWTLLGFEIWHQTFLDLDRPKPIRI